MKENFDRAFDLTVIRFEGGAAYTNDPDDPGGETKYGISKRANPDVDILNLTKAAAKEIYRHRYWNPIGGDEMPYPWDVIVFDTAVNLGVSRSLGFKAEVSSPAEYHLERLAYYMRLVAKRPVMVKFFRGWAKRVVQLWQETRT